MSGMETRVLHVAPPVTPQSPAVQAGAALIRAGELVAFPTETVYGLGANALDAAAVAKIFTAKGRPIHDPLIVHIASPDQVHAVAERLPPLAYALIAACFPGALTLVLPRRQHVPPNVSAGLPTVGVRMPAHPVALTLIEAAGVPLAAPSANLFAHTSPTTAAHVLADLGGRIPLILDGGATDIGVESTILDLSGEHPRLLRPGGVSLERIQAIVGDVKIEIVQRYAGGGDPMDSLPAPGMFLKHYAPHAPLSLYEGEDSAVRAALQQAVNGARAAGERIGLLILEEDRPAFAAWEGNPQIVIGSLGKGASPDQAAARLYTLLRHFDAAEVTVIFARAMPPVGIGAAVQDRLMRAAAGRIIRL